MFGQVGVLALGGWLALHGSIKIGVFLAFSLYIGQLVAPVRALTTLITIGQEARASVIRVYEVIDSKPVVTEKPGAVDLPAGTPDVELDDVAFGYLPSEPVLRGLSLRVRPGETLAVVGTSGSGKSTISLLLPRFYDVRGGAIRVGGQDVRDLTLDSLRASIGLVMEDSFLFSDTIRANISYGRPDATQEQIVAAARAAEADEFITSLPDGYDTVIGEQGLTLSGGQRQRVSLARALITDPAILMLDDATSAIDAGIEAQIHATLRKVMAGRTTLLIAHRRSTLQLADRIAVLDEGRLVDEGTHEELTARCPLYRLLLAGPGDDAEGVDAGELAYHENAGRAIPPPDGTGLRHASPPPCGRPADAPGSRPRRARTAASWPAWPAPRSAAAWAPPRAAAGAGSGAGGSMLAGIPPTPELLAKVDALPPADELPGVDASGPARRPALHPAPAAAADRPGAVHRAGPRRPRRHRRRRHARAGPRRRRQRRPGQGIPPHHRGLADRARDRLRRLGHQRRPDERGGTQRRADALHAAREDLLPPAAARPRLLRARAVRPDHDPDDDGRGRAVDVPADRADHHGQLGPDVRRRADRAAVHQLPAGPHAADDHPGAGGGDAGVPGEVLEGLHRCPREGQHRQRRPAGERRRAADRAGLPARGAQPGAFRRPEQQLPPVPAAGAALHRAVLPVRAAAVDRRRAR